MSRNETLLENLARGIDTKAEFGDTHAELAASMVRGMRHEAAFYPRAVAAVAQRMLDNADLLAECRDVLREALTSMEHDCYDLDDPGTAILRTRTLIAKLEGAK